jgi:Arc/MetJ-type ribon-helix-helix transcriptional regulator
MNKVARNIINISLPATMAADIRREVHTEGFASISEYFRSIIREHKKNRLAEELQKDKVAFETGKAHKLTSLRSLR